MMNRPTRHRGFALLMALVLVVLAGAVLAGVARRSGVRALQAREATEQLQRRWAMTTAQSTLLPRVPLVLEATERGDVELDPEGEPVGYANAPVPALTVDCRLAGLQYRFILTDEQAKVNVNTLVGMYGLGDTRTMLQRAMTQRRQSSQQSPLTVRLRRNNTAEDVVGRRAFESFGQVIEQTDIARLIGDDADGPASLLTFWTNGQLNIRRASPEALKMLGRRSLGPQLVSELIELRDEAPYTPLKQLKGRLSRFDREQEEQIDRLLTDESSCHGLWMIANGSLRSWTAFAVGIGDVQNGLWQTHAYHW